MQKKVIQEIPNKSISFEVFSDSLDKMISQGEEIASWGQNVFVKIPITNTLGISTASVVKKLSDQGVKVNVTAIMTIPQVQAITDVLNPNYESYISVFAGSIADTGRDPMPIMRESLNVRF